MKYFKKYLPYILVFILFFSSFGIWYKISAENNQDDYLTVVFLDVGQGDAIYIEAPNGKQMLIDGGADAKILQRLSEVMPFGDRSIDLVLATHPDMDHIGGLVFVLEDYRVTNIIENGIVSETRIYKDLQAEISKKKINKVTAEGHMKIILDKEKNIYFDILFPDRDVSELDSNDGSVVGRLVYGEKSFMLTGDASIYTENKIQWNENSATLHSQVLKLGHHGSKTSSGILWLEDVDPEIAVISVGRNNRYKHPSKEVLDRLNELNIPYLSTSKEGSIIFKTDGINLIY